MAWLKVKIPASAEPARVYQISDKDFAIDEDGYLVAFAMYSERLDKVIHMILNKREQSLENWKHAYTHAVTALKSATSSATLLGILGLSVRPKYGKGGALSGAVAGIFTSLDDLRSAWKNIEAELKGHTTLKAGYYCQDTGALVTTFPKPIVANDITIV